ncbi:MAG TPA: DUF167 family protein [Gaiellaceae bacterium]|nr:DUF167 family protein [Gaiellaceae bacterium]
MAESPTRLRIRVSPGASRSEIVGRHGDAWKVRVSSPAERGRANDAVLRLLAARLRLPVSGLSLVSGHTAKDKVVELRGLGADEVDRRLESGRRLESS